MRSSNRLRNQGSPEIERIKKRIEDLECNLKRHRDSLVQAEILGVVNHGWREPGSQGWYFQRWFSELVEVGELNSYVDEEFTPIVEQGGYELEVDSLSGGGEKTSVALAYRLALNTIVKQVTDTLKSNLLILDEPTDAFSREQLHKMRDILNDVNYEQVIIVSHEAELENVADHIYRVQKDVNTSTVTSP